MYFSNNLNKLYVFEAIKYSFNNVFEKISARFARSASTIIINCEKSPKKIPSQFHFILYYLVLYVSYATLAQLLYYIFEYILRV